MLISILIYVQQLLTLYIHFKITFSFPLHRLRLLVRIWIDHIDLNKPLNSFALNNPGQRNAILLCGPLTIIWGTHYRISYTVIEIIKYSNRFVFIILPEMTNEYRWWQNIKFKWSSETFITEKYMKSYIISRIMMNP